MSLRTRASAVRGKTLILQLEFHFQEVEEVAGRQIRHVVQVVSKEFSKAPELAPESTLLRTTVHPVLAQCSLQTPQDSPEVHEISLTPGGIILCEQLNEAWKNQTLAAP